MSQDVMLTVMNSMSLNNDYVNMEIQECDLCEKCLNLDAELSKSKQAYNDFLKNYSQLEKHCISLEASMQLQQEVFQNNESCVNQNAVEIQEYFEINDLKARLQDKDKTISNSKILCATCNKSMFDGVHDKCLLDLVKNRNKRTISTKKHKKQNVWKPTGHVFTEVGFKWKPTGRIFTMVGNSCPLTRITSTDVVPPKQTTSHLDEIQKPEIKVYSRKPKNARNIGSSKIAKIGESKNANHSEPNQIWGSIAIDIPSSSSLVMTGCPDCTMLARIMGYGDYQLGNIVMSRVYYVEGRGHNLFSVGQFCDADLEVAFRKNTCFICNLEDVDLLSGSRDINLYKNSLDDILKSSPIYLLSKASKTKSWLWHRRLSHLNFGTLNKLAKDDLARGIPRLKFQKDHLCSAYALGKSRKSSHQPKAEDTNQEKLYLLHMDLVKPNANQHSLLHPKPFINPPLIQQTPYELMQDKKPDLSFFDVFGALCYPTNDNDNQGKLDVKADIGIFVGYAPTKKAFRIYYKRTRKIIETIHMKFDELTVMASKQFSSGPGLHSITPATSSLGLIPNPIPQQPCIPPPRYDWDHLFQPMFDEYFTPPSIVVSSVPEAVALRAVILVDSLMLTSIDQDVSSTSIPSIQDQ
ncbi:integrase, catalytic region, zinc finger, CCHC-type containing protein [Tanacetum coccineum]